MQPVKRKVGLSQILAFTAIGLFASQALAQDPLVSLPQAYKLQFENEWVKVTRVHYAPNEKLPGHQHTQSPSAYVYLNNSGPVVFKHIGLAYGAVTRQPTKEGTFRLYQAVQEIHEVENLSDLPSDFLRVEFKTEPLNEKALRGRFNREEYPAGENFQKIQFENEQIRITRLVCAPGKNIELSTTPTEPTLIVALSSSSFKVNSGKGKSAGLKLEKGQTSWIPVGQQQRFDNTGSAPAEVLRFEFKTRPMSKETLEEKKKHEHPQQ